MGEAGISAMESAQAAPPSGSAALLLHLKGQGGERFDPAGWHYLSQLAWQAARHEGSVQRMLEAKLEQSMAAFSERFERARKIAAELLHTACTKHPQAAAELQRLFAEGDFRGLRQLRASLEAREQCAALADLVLQLEPAVSRTAGHAHAPARNVPSHASAMMPPPRELKTVRESRATWARLSVDRQLSQAMKQGPQNAGPINSHMLVLRSLSMMQDVSPDYLSHMVSYVDTLLALDPGEKEVPVKRKKAPAAKASKHARTGRK